MDMNVSEISAINFYFCGILSILINAVLIFLLYRRSLRVVGAFKYLMMISAALDASFSLVSIIASPTFMAVDMMNSVLIMKGGFVLPGTVGCVSLVLFLLLLCQSIVTPPCLFVFRYLQICSHLTTCALLCVASWPTTFDRNKFEPLVRKITEETGQGFLIATLNLDGSVYDDIQSGIMYADAVLLTFSMVSSLVVMLFCTKSIIVTLLQINSTNTRRLQIQLYKILLMQFSIPFVLIHIPFYLCILAPLVHITSGIFTAYLPYLFAWYPVINPLIVLCLIGKRYPPPVSSTGSVLTIVRY
ncbi:hypothetical protein Aduo_010816 [Ancylostoma duodenale]